MIQSNMSNSQNRPGGPPCAGYVCYGFRECVYNRKAGYAQTSGSSSCWLRASSCQLAAWRAAGAQPCDSCCRNTSRRMQQPGARAPSSATVRRITAIAGLCPPGNFAHRGAVCVTCARIHWFGQMPTMATHTARAACVLHRRVSRQFLHE